MAGAGLVDEGVCRGVVLRAHQLRELPWAELPADLEVGTCQGLSDPVQLGEDDLGGPFRTTAWRTSRLILRASKLTAR